MSSASERTEKATPKRREDARKKGQIARGAELPAALGFLGTLIAVYLLSGNIFKKISFYIQESSRHILEGKPLNPADVHDIFIEAVKILTILVAPIVLVGLVAGVAGNFAQGGLILNTEGITPKAERFNPAQNIKKIFGLDSVVNLIKSSIKLIFVGAISYTVLSPLMETAPTLLQAAPASVAVKIGETLYTLAFRCGLILLAIALADYGYVWYKHEKSIKMSKQEIRDEYKEQEGDPLIKSQRRRAARALVQRNSLAELPSASVVITNPTHFAVALRYDREKDAAPVVIAKGADKLAAKIREIARENQVPLIENPPLARALYRLVEPNQTIPVEFFGAVAEILAYVFRQK